MSYYKELAHMITEAEKSHDLPSARWRPTRAHGVLRAGKPMAEVQVEGSWVCSSSNSQAECEFPFPPSFCFI